MSSFSGQSHRPNTLKWITYAVLAAIVAGLALRFWGGESLNAALADYVLTPLRTMFLNALKMLVVPVVFFSIAASVSSVGDLRDYGRIGIKVLIFYTSTSFAAIAVGYLVYELLQPGAGVALELSAYAYTADVGDFSLLDTVVDIVPSSFAGALTGTNMLQVIFLAVLTGVAAALLAPADRKKIAEALGLLNRLFLKLAWLVMLVIPLATFCAVTLLVLTIDTTMLLALVKLAAGMVLGAAGMLGVYGLLFWLFTRQSPVTLFRKCAPSFLSFVTLCSTSAVMGQSLDTCTRRLGIDPKVSSFSMPLGSTINMDGACIYLTLSVLFLAAVYHVPLSLGMLLKLAVTIVILSMGAPPIAGAGFICLSILVLQLGIPLEGVGILMGIDQLMSMCRTLINGSGDFTGTAVVAHSEGLMDTKIFNA
jgi:Na+/H+-dicarboxylate symporter